MDEQYVHPNLLISDEEFRALVLAAKERYQRDVRPHLPPRKEITEAERANMRAAYEDIMAFRRQRTEWHESVKRLLDNGSSGSSL